MIGVAANANIQFMELVQHGYPPSVFNPDFPRDLVLFLFGAPVLLPIGLWLSAAGLGLWALRARALVVGLGGGGGRRRGDPVAGAAAGLPVPSLLHLPRAGVRVPDGGGDRALEGAGAHRPGGRGRRGRRPGHRVTPRIRWRCRRPRLSSIALMPRAEPHASSTPTSRCLAPTRPTSKWFQAPTSSAAATRSWSSAGTSTLPCVTRQPSSFRGGPSSRPTTRPSFWSADPRAV